MYLFFHYPMRSSATVTVEGELPIKIRYELSVTGWTSEGTDPEPEEPPLAFDPSVLIDRIVGAMRGVDPADGFDANDVIEEFNFIHDLPEDDDALDAIFGLGEAGDPEVENNQQDDDSNER